MIFRFLQALFYCELYVEAAFYKLKSNSRVTMASNAVETFEVKLDETNRVFFPGDTVSGCVNLKLKEDLKIKEMRLECRGEAYVNWPEYSGSYTRYHYNKERYFSTMAVIFDEGKEKKNDVNSVACISGGRYRFSFKFIIPDKYLPTSFEGRYGNIRYWARAVIERGLGKSDIKTKPAQFLIGDYVALEDFEHVSDVVIEEDSHTTGWPCFKSGTLILRAEIDRGGFQQGDDINVSVLVTNETSRDVACTEVSLVQRTLFVGIEGGKTLSDHTICYVRKQGVVSGWEQEFPKISLTIPPKTFPTLISCKCIAVLYFILVKAKLKGKFTKDGYLEIPVVIACSADESEVPAQKDPQVRPVSQRPKRRKGTFFCVTGKTSLTGDLNDSSLEFRDQNEGDKFIVSPLSRPSENLEGNFTEIVNQYDLTNSFRKISTRKGSDTTHFLNNGGLKLISIV